jgi:hypothetical protein
MAVLRPVSRSFGHRLRLRALHLDTLLRSALDYHQVQMVSIDERTFGDASALTRPPTP